jgi:hypothetical protein
MLPFLIPNCDIVVLQACLICCFNALEQRIQVIQCTKECRQRRQVIWGRGEASSSKDEERKTYRTSGFGSVCDFRMDEGH